MLPNDAPMCAQYAEKKLHQPESQVPRVQLRRRVRLTYVIRIRIVIYIYNIYIYVYTPYILVGHCWIVGVNDFWSETRVKKTVPLDILCFRKPESHTLIGVISNPLFLG